MGWHLLLRYETGKSSTATSFTATTKQWTMKKLFLLLIVAVFALPACAPTADETPEVTTELQDERGLTDEEEEEQENSSSSSTGG